MTLWIIIGVGLTLIALERARPARGLPPVRGWWARALVLNATQLGAVFLGALTWDRWFRGDGLMDLSGWPPWAAGGVAYLVSTFVYYWWHRARHEWGWLWRTLHQVHHSPARLEIITSFYKHPLEQVANGVLTAIIVFPLLGLSLEAAAVNTLLCGLAEFVYHVNLRTPVWLGYLIQRPEMHRVHHERGRHRGNYADLPVWDLLFGTFHNPAAGHEVECGFEPEREARLGAMLAFEDLHRPPRPGRARRVGLAALLTLGLLQMVGDGLGRVWPAAGRAVAGLGALTVASPKPKVFTAAGPHEPFAFAWTVELETAAGGLQRVPLDAATYGQVPGPYPYRNVYGAMLAFGPLLPAATVQAVLRHGFCDGVLATALGVGPTVPPVRVACEEAS